MSSCLRFSGTYLYAGHCLLEYSVYTHSHSLSLTCECTSLSQSEHNRTDQSSNCMVFEALQQSFMDLELSCSSCVPWIWIIETLALSNQVDASLLLDLVEKSPEISDDLGRNAREMVSLRILESVFVHGANANYASSTSSTRILFNPSERCEDVIQQILHKKDSGPEMLKWDLEPFIRKKRASLTQSTLQQLKDAILTGNHPVVASLKKQSGLSVEDQSEHEVPVDDGNCGTALTLGDSTNEYTSSKGIISHEKILLQEEQVPHIDTIVPNDKFDEEPEQNGIKEAEGDKEGLLGGLETANEDMNAVEQNIPMNVSNADEAENLDIYSDSEDDEEMTDIAIEKNAFLSSQWTYSQDSAAIADLSEQNLCRKCNEGGKLLTCGSNTCKFVVHEGCLGSAASFDTRGDFYCPSCSYIQAILKYQEAMKKFSSARKDLRTFFFSGTSRKLKKQPRGSNQMERDECMGKINEVIHREFEQQGKHGTTNRDDKNDQEEKKMGQYLQSPLAQEQHQRVSLLTQGDHLSCQFTERSDTIERHVETSSKNGVLRPPGTELSSQSTRTRSSKSTDAEEEMSGEENESSDASKYIIRYRKQDGQNSCGQVPKKRH